MQSLYAFAIWLGICITTQLDEPKRSDPKPPWLAISAEYHGRELRLALVLENQLMHLLDNPRSDGQVEPVYVSGKAVPKPAIHNLDKPRNQGLATRCRTSQFQGVLGLEAIPTRFLVIDQKLQVAECSDNFEAGDLRVADTHRLVVDDNGFWCILVRFEGKDYAFQLCSIAKMSVSIHKSFPLAANDVQKSQFLGPAFDPTSAEPGPGNAVNLLLARPEITKIAIDRSRMEVIYYSEKE